MEIRQIRTLCKNLGNHYKKYSFRYDETKVLNELSTEHYDITFEQAILEYVEDPIVQEIEKGRQIKTAAEAWYESQYQMWSIKEADAYQSQTWYLLIEPYLYAPTTYCEEFTYAKYLTVYWGHCTVYNDTASNTIFELSNFFPDTDTIWYHDTGDYKDDEPEEVDVQILMDYLKQDWVEIPPYLVLSDWDFSEGEKIDVIETIERYTYDLEIEGLERTYWVTHYDELDYSSLVIIDIMAGDKRLFLEESLFL